MATWNLRGTARPVDRPSLSRLAFRSHGLGRLGRSPILLTPSRSPPARGGRALSPIVAAWDLSVRPPKGGTALSPIMAAWDLRGTARPVDRPSLSRLAFRSHGLGRLGRSPILLTPSRSPPARGGRALSPIVAAWDLPVRPLKGGKSAIAHRGGLGSAGPPPKRGRALSPDYPPTGSPATHVMTTCAQYSSA